MERERRLLTTSEAGELLGLSRDYVAMLCRKGAIRSTRFLDTGNWRIPLSEIERIHNGEEVKVRKSLVDTMTIPELKKFISNIGKDYVQPPAEST